MILNTANNAASTLGSGITDSDTSLSVQAGDGASFPDPPFVVSIGDEIILVEAKSSDTFSSLTRGYEGTSAASHSAGDDVENRWTAGQAEAIGGHPVTALTYASSITWDVQDDPNPSLTLTGDATLDASNLPSRVQSGVIKVTQDGTGGHSLTFGSGFTAEGGTAPSVDETASATTYVFYAVDDEADTVLIAEEAEGENELPTGGTTGQVLEKASNTDYDVQWGDPPSGGDATRTLGDVTFSASQTIDFDGDDVQTITVTGDITISTTNRGDGSTLKEVQVHLVSDGTAAHTLAFDSDVKVADSVPSTVPDGGATILTLISKGSAETDTVAMVLSEHASWTVASPEGDTGFIDFSSYSDTDPITDFTDIWGLINSVTAVADASAIGGIYARMNAEAGRALLYVTSLGTSIDDYELLMKVKHMSNGEVLNAHGNIGGSVGSENAYRFRYLSNGDNNISKWEGGSFNSFSSATRRVWSQGDWGWIRAQKIGTALKVNAWPDSEASEPSGWGVEVTDDPALSAGGVGFGSTPDSTTDYDIDYIAWSLDPSTTPAPSPA